ETVGNRPDADLPRHGNVVRQLCLRLARDELQRAEETSGVPRSEHLFGIGARSAAATHFARDVQFYIQLAVVAARLAVAPAGSGGLRSIYHLLDSHIDLLCLGAACRSGPRGKKRTHSA